MEQEVRLYNEMETYIGDRLSAGGGCEAVVTARTGCGGVNFLEF